MRAIVRGALAVTVTAVGAQWSSAFHKHGPHQGQRQARNAPILSPSFFSGASLMVPTVSVPAPSQTLSLAPSVFTTSSFRTTTADLFVPVAVPEVSTFQSTSLLAAPAAGVHVTYLVDGRSGSAPRQNNSTLDPSSVSAASADAVMARLDAIKARNEAVEAQRKAEAAAAAALASAGTAQSFATAAQTSAANANTSAVQAAQTVRSAAGGLSPSAALTPGASDFNSVLAEYKKALQDPNRNAERIQQLEQSLRIAAGQS